jgi:hypothetical protein
MDTSQHSPCLRAQDTGVKSSAVQPLIQTSYTVPNLQCYHAVAFVTSLAQKRVNISITPPRIYCTLSDNQNLLAMRSTATTERWRHKHISS